MVTIRCACFVLIAHPTDIVMPDVDGVAAIRQIVRESPDAHIIALTMYREEQVMLDAIRAGARGYLLKSATFQPNGLPASEAVALLARALTANCLARSSCSSGEP